MPEPDTRWPTSPLAHFRAMIRGRCPRCCQGKIFHGRFAMNDPCPVCGLIFQREEGYFLGAMYTSYLISSVLLMGGYFLGRALLPDWDPAAIVGLSCILYLPLVPFVFRYSRIVWIHFERWICPSDISAGAFEKSQARHFREHGQPDSAENGARPS
jgi:uncharacterized protein (DUF983 family)